ncbi:MAG: BrxA family protein, partial [bacterium]
MRDYNTAINVLGSISDINVIIETIRYFQENGLEETKREFIDGNAFGYNITSSRQRFFALIKKLFLKNHEEEDNRFFIDTIANNAPSNSFKRLLLYLEVFRKNDLFSDITLNLVYKKYQENRRLIDTNEILNFLLEFGEGTKIIEWSESTLKIIGSKYMSFMKRAGVFKKDKGYKSMIVYPSPDEKIITYLVYLIKATGISDNEVYDSNMFKGLMLQENQKVELLKKGSLAGYYDFNFSGAKNAT